MSNSRSASAGKGGQRGRNGVGGHLEVIPYRPHRSRKVQALLVLWRWFFELLFAAFLIWVTAKVGDLTGLSWLWSTLLVLAVLGLPFTIPQVRRPLVAVFWLSITRHRLRAFFVECRIFNLSGKLPWIVAARPIPVGERIWLWLVPGLSVTDFEHRVEDIAAACWATTVRIERHKRYAFLVRLDIVRRDPLTSGGVLPSTLVPAGVSTAGGTDSDLSGPLDVPRTVIDLTVPLARNSADGKSRKVNSTNASTGPRATSALDSEPSPAARPVVTRGGEDVSDYV
jgi:hypothetical protein